MISERHSKASSERMRKHWQDPEFRAKQRAGIKAAFDKGKGNDKRSDNLRARWKNPRTRKNLMESQQAYLENGGREKRAEVFARLRADPAYEAKRLRKWREAMEKKKNRLKAAAMILNRKRRGFDVPAHLWDEYQRLVKSKRLRAREAAIVLGIIKEAA